MTVEMNTLPWNDELDNGKPRDARISTMIQEEKNINWGEGVGSTGAHE